jgi:hypothetical protein
VQRGQFVILPCVGLHRRMHDGQVSVRLLEQQRQNTRTISRRLLNAYLGRTLSDEEFSSVASMWLQEAHTGVAATGHRVLSEAYARFAAAEPNVGYRRRVRRITAARWAISAITLMRRGALAEAAHHLFYVLRWHPLGLADGAAFVAERSLVRLLRVIRSAR